MARHVVVPLPAASGVVVNTSGCLLAASVAESTGSAPAAYTLYDGSSSGGVPIMPVTLNANESIRDSWRHGVYHFRQGLYLNITLGAITGSVSVLLEHDDELFWAAVYQQLYGTS